MAVIYVPGAITGTQYAVNISGDVPTPSEQARIDQYVAQQEAAAQAQYQSIYGAPVEPGAVPEAPPALKKNLTVSCPAPISENEP